MKAPGTILSLPLAGVLFLMLFVSPFFLVQVLPRSVTQEAWFVAGVNERGEAEESLVTYSIAGGVFRLLPHFDSSGWLWRGSCLAHQWYFEPVARVLRKFGWCSRFRYL